MCDVCGIDGPSMPSVTTTIWEAEVCFGFPGAATVFNVMFGNGLAPNLRSMRSSLSREIRKTQHPR
jgi:hypothetical protein